MGSIPGADPLFDVLILGAGLSGLCTLYHIRQRFPDWRIKVLEKASDVGGTWFYNSYPGCRVDTESLSYCFSFDKELLREWHWKDTFSTQPEVQKYIRRFSEKNDLLRDIIFNTAVVSATWNNSTRTWNLATENGGCYTTSFCISSIGFLSAPALPDIPGISSFAGNAFHTSRWPKDLDVCRDFAGKRIGVIGTGATGIQTITALSENPDIKSLSVFQRTANWSAPLRNEEISQKDMEQHVCNYEALFKRCAATPSGFLHMADPRKTLDVSPAERQAHWEKIYSEPGFSKWLGVFSDTYTDREANALYSDFIANKIRERVRDPEVAESLIPKDHGFGMRRVPLETGYFEAYNHPNVYLVDLKKTPISTVNATGIVTADGQQHELDALIFATGFDAITGAFRAIDWRGKDGRPLVGVSGTPEGERAVWLDHRPYTFLGMTIPSMPNLITVMGPHQPVGNASRNIEHSAQVALGILEHCKKNGYTYVEATTGAADAWTEHVADCTKGSLINEVDSWMTGVNKNVKGKTVRMVARYAGPVQEYRRRCQDCKDKGYEGLIFA
jgi:cation diffusion facilitator CzcD-associated flavoprotein CzcO